MRTLVLTTTVLCLFASGCGSASHGGALASPSTSTTVPPSQSITGDYDGDDEYGHKGGSDGDNDDSTLPKDQDNDSDSRGKGYFDSDDDSVLDFGHAADAEQKKTITRLVRDYFAAANREDGATACSVIAASFAKAVPEDLGRPPGPLYAQGTTCARVMTKVFAHYHRQLSAHAATLRVAAVRVKGDEGMVVLVFKGLPGRQLRVAREGNVWRVGALLDLELP